MFENGFLSFEKNSYRISRSFSPSVSLPRTLVENLVRDNHPEVLRDAVAALTPFGAPSRSDRLAWKNCADAISSKTHDSITSLEGDFYGLSPNI